MQHDMLAATRRRFIRQTEDGINDLINPHGVEYAARTQSGDEQSRQCHLILNAVATGGTFSATFACVNAAGEKAVQPPMLEQRTHAESLKINPS
jgi:hypothetical protein